MLGCNFSALTIVLFSFIFGWGSPVTALQILIIKVACDGIPGFSLCVEKADPDIMKQPPVKKGSSIFAGGLISKIIQISIVFTVATLIPVWIGQHYYLGSGIQPSFAVAQTMTFLVMGLTTVVHVYNCRTHLSIFQKGRGVNKLVIGTTCWVSLRAGLVMPHRRQKNRARSYSLPGYKCLSIGAFSDDFAAVDGREELC